MFHKIEIMTSMALLVAIVILVSIAAVTRAIGMPIFWSVEIAQLLFVWLCMFAADIALQEKRHFGLLILLDNLNPKLRRLVEIFNLLVLMSLLTLLFFYAIKNVQLMHPRLVGATQMHASLIHGSMVVGLALLFRTMASQLNTLIRHRGNN